MNFYTIKSMGITKAIVDLDEVLSVHAVSEAGVPFIEIQFKGDKCPVRVNVNPDELGFIMSNLNERLSNL